MREYGLEYGLDGKAAVIFHRCQADNTIGTIQVVTESLRDRQGEPKSFLDQKEKKMDAVKKKAGRVSLIFFANV